MQIDGTTASEQCRWTKQLLVDDADGLNNCWWTMQMDQTTASEQCRCTKQLLVDNAD